MADNTTTGPAGDPNMLKGNEIARSVMGSGVKPDGFHVDFLNGVASLTGSVASEEERQKVLSAARGITGVASVKDGMQVGGAGTASSPAKTLGGQAYTVKAGDTLTGIAQAHYGKASESKRIFEANKDVLSDPDKIRAGQTIKLP